MALKRILITTDFSRHAHFALKRAIQIAEFFQAELTCLHVINQNWLPLIKADSSHDEESAINEAEHAFARALKDTATSYPIKFTTLTGRAPDQINQYINDNDIQLVLMGAHGTYYLNDYILGTNSESVVKQANIPIQLIKKEPDHYYQRVLVSTDLSDASKKAAETAFQLYPDAEFLLLHIADVWYGKYLDDISKNQQFDDEMSQNLQKKLDRFLEECEVDATRFSTKFIGGYPANDIVKYASIWDAQLVVAGTRGHSLLHYILIGRTIDRLLRTSTTDMLVVPS
ncbi:MULTISPECIES: universal stress protein [unclassified Legionella]|uniref:universal stress protein n=1 Tax=unclassified Legionella TaxID=2622702 RepID=UPI001054F71B|nr:MULTISPECIES: universal stress protein [unclassified Legionella]MDI9819751.1 universal stress protein [Legionella sp. PL877]